MMKKTLVKTIAILPTGKRNMLNSKHNKDSRGFIANKQLVGSVDRKLLSRDIKGRKIPTKLAS